MVPGGQLPSTSVVPGKQKGAPAPISQALRAVPTAHVGTRAEGQKFTSCSRGPQATAITRLADTARNRVPQVMDTVRDAHSQAQCVSPSPRNLCPCSVPHMVLRVPCGLGTSLPHPRRRHPAFLPPHSLGLPASALPSSLGTTARGVMPGPAQTLQGCPSGSSPHLRPNLCPLPLHMATLASSPSRLHSRHSRCLSTLP